MSLHTKAAHWFETYVPRDKTVYALEALAATGKVELEKDYVTRPILDTQELRRSMTEYRELVGRYADLLPEPRPAGHVLTDHPADTAREALAGLRDRLARELRLRRLLHELGTRRHALQLLQRCLHAMDRSGADLADLGDESRFLCKRIYACPAGLGQDRRPDLPGLSQVYVDGDAVFQVVLCLPEQRQIYDQAFADSKCETLELPDWLIAHWAQRQVRVAERLDILRRRAASARRELQRHRDDAGLSSAVDTLAVLDWYLQHTVTLTEDRQFCYLTGWTTADTPSVLQRPLERLGIDAKIVFRPAFPGHPPPVDVGGTRLFSPFRQFVTMFGIPAAGEPDPTPLLSLLVPVLFGFMFPDVGHGLVLAAVSVLLSVHYPSLRFLAPCGLAAAGFGALFGETFGLHDPIPAILLHPLDAPLTILLASLGLGAAIILLGLALSGIGAYWRGALRQWLWLDGAVLTLYVSGLLGLLYPPVFVVTVLALAWYLAGLVATGSRPLWHGLGRLAQSTLELVLNTLSFARIGAFALAHAALSHALLEIVALVEPPLVEAILLVLGHALIIAVEGLVVFVQTTRLVLFEFFSRFLRADGRLFRPLESPTAST